LGGLLCFRKVVRSSLHTEGLAEEMTMIMGFSKGSLEGIKKAILSGISGRIFISLRNVDGFVKSLKSASFVIPAKAGIQ